MPLVIGIGRLQIPRNHFEILVGVLVILGGMRLLEKNRQLVGNPWGSEFAGILVVWAVVGARTWSVLQSPSTWTHPVDWLVAPVSTSGAIGAIVIAVAVHWARHRRPRGEVWRIWMPVNLGALSLYLMALALNQSSWVLGGLSGLAAVLTGQWVNGNASASMALAQTLWAWGTLILLSFRLVPFPPFEWTIGHITAGVASWVGWVLMGRQWWRMPGRATKP